MYTLHVLDVSAMEMSPSATSLPKTPSTTIWCPQLARGLWRGRHRWRRFCPPPSLLHSAALLDQCPTEHKSVSFFTELNIFQVLGANPMPWDVNNKIMSFYSHKKKLFSVCAREMTFWKYYRQQKKKTNFLSNWVSKGFILMWGF